MAVRKAKLAIVRSSDNYDRTNTGRKVRIGKERRPTVPATWVLNPGG
jgi:hypothetical protein